MADSTTDADDDDRPRFEEITCVEFVDLLDEASPSDAVRSADGTDDGSEN